MADQQPPDATPGNAAVPARTEEIQAPAVPDSTPVSCACFLWFFGSFVEWLAVKVSSESGGGMLHLVGTGFLLFGAVACYAGRGYLGAAWKRSLPPAAAADLKALSTMLPVAGGLTWLLGWWAFSKSGAYLLGRANFFRSLIATSPDGLAAFWNFLVFWPAASAALFFRAFFAARGKV